jgi:3-oxoadipate enol-lactonase
MPEALLNDVKLYYREEGNGTPLLLLHGLTASMLMYKNEIAQLKNNFHVIALDSRGHGKSEKTSNYTLKDHVQDVIALMDYLDIKKANIMGISMGSYIAQGVAIKSPERVEKLILVSAKSHGKTSSLARLFTQYQSELEGLNQIEKVNYLSQYIFHNLDAVGKSMKELGENSIMLTPEQQASANKALEGFDFRPELHKINVETLVISGKYDGLNPPEDGREIANLIPNSTFIEFEKSGHSPNVEEPDRFMATITDFLK